MPQVDIETLVTAWTGRSNDSKISCETLEDTAADGQDEDYAEDVTPDLPSGSFWLSKDAEYDWFNRNAFYERDESTKGYAKNSNTNPNLNPSSNSTSQKLSAKFMSKASILRLPKAHDAAFLDTKRRTCKPVNTRLLILKRFASSGNSMVSVAEPRSPKVSCMGRVRSRRCRRRLDSLRRGEKPVEKEKTRLYSIIMNLFRFRKGVRKPDQSGIRKTMEAVEEEPAATAVEPRRKSLSVKVGERVGGEIAAEPPGLGGMKRFSSGRRPETGQPSFQSGGDA